MNKRKYRRQSRRKYLKEDEIDYIHPKFRRMIRKAFKNGEQVPFGVVYLSGDEPSAQDIETAKKIIANLKCV